VNRGERARLISRGVRFALVFVLLLLPLPWLPDAYVTALGLATNATLSALDAHARFAVRYELPARIARDGSWKARLRMDDRLTSRSAPFVLDARSFSYRPVATFVALAAAWPVAGRRRRLVLWAAGGASLFLLTTAFSALPLLSQFAVAGAFGDFPGRLIRTLYQATATPVMVYALPLFVWLFWRFVMKADDTPAPTAPSPSRTSATSS
jgi:hypothetical protein